MSMADVLGKLNLILSKNEETNKNIEQLNEQIKDLANVKDELSDHSDRIYALEEDNKNIRIQLSKIASKVDDTDSDEEVDEELIQRENRRRGAFKKMKLVQSPDKVQPMGIKQTYSNVITGKSSVLRHDRIVTEQTFLDRNRNAHMAIDISQYIVGLSPISENNIEHHMKVGDAAQAEKNAAKEYVKHSLNSEIKIEEIVATKKGKKDTVYVQLRSK